MNLGDRAGTTTLAYHDVVDVGAPDASGFPGPDAGRYKLEWPRFREHLDALALAVSGPPVTARDVLDGAVPATSWALTFDDGGASSVEIAGELASRGWRGQFFVTTGRIGTPGFVDADAIRELARAGHVVGSHSHTHPQRMSTCSPSELLDEWQTSCELLASVLGRRPEIAAVPGGYYSDEVARAAARAGVRVLYTSEPVRSTRTVDGCLVLGRFALLGSSRARTAGRLAAGRPLPRLQQRARRMALSQAKRLSGDGYLRARSLLLRLRDR